MANSRTSVVDEHLLMKTRPPARFGHEFLRWLRLETEEAWAGVHEDPPDEHRIGPSWTRGTRWRRGLSDLEIARIQNEWRLDLPTDYRLFLSELYTTDRPPIVAQGTSGAREGVTFTVWTGDRSPIDSAINEPFRGLMEDIEATEYWLPSWGPRPKNRSGRAKVLEAEAQKAPRLVPVLGNRYLLAIGSATESAVLSIYGADIVELAPNLRDYLLFELRGVLGGPETPDRAETRTSTASLWGDVLAHPAGFRR